LATTTTDLSEYGINFRGGVKKFCAKPNPNTELIQYHGYNRRRR